MNDLDQRFAELVMARGLLTQAQVDEAGAHQKVVQDMGIRKRLDEIMVDKKWLMRPLAKSLLRSLKEKGLSRAAAEPISVDSSSDDLDPGLRIPGYELVKRIGQGGMGEVFQARQLNLDRTVAIKVLHAGRATDKRSVKRFLREARATAKLNHPNIVRGLEVGQVDGFHFFVMEFIEGQTLQALLKEHGPLDEYEALEYLLASSRALAHAHKHGIVHRDIKPPNIMVDKNGQVKITDLGIMRAVEQNDGAGLTLPGRLLGTPNYMSPEQATSGSQTDGRSDIFSLGASFYHLLTGRPPFHARGIARILQNVLHKKPRDPRELRPDLSERTAEILLKCLAKSPNERYASCNELAGEIEACLREKKTADQAPSPQPAQRPQAADAEATRLEPWPYPDSTSVSDDEPGGDRNASSLQILPTTGEIRQALNTHFAQKDTEPVVAPAPPAVRQRRAPSRIMWLLIGILLGLIVGAIARPWENIDWDAIGLPQARSWLGIDQPMEQEQ